VTQGTVFASKEEKATADALTCNTLVWPRAVLGQDDSEVLPAANLVV
jgi:hypothetical protein